MLKTDKEYCAWLLREVWGKTGNLRSEEQAKIHEYSLQGEAALDTVLRVTGIPKTAHKCFSNEARDYYRQEAQRILDAKK